MNSRSIGVFKLGTYHVFGKILQFPYYTYRAFKKYSNVKLSLSKVRIFLFFIKHFINKLGLKSQEILKYGIESRESNNHI